MRTKLFTLCVTLALLAAWAGKFSAWANSWPDGHW
jgi:hypothetical protein